jgi:hypothetical protein
MAIAACFVFQREISRSVFWDFFDTIDPKATSELSVGPPHGFFRPTETSKLRCPQWRFCN